MEVAAYCGFMLVLHERYVSKPPSTMIDIGGAHDDVQH